MSKTTELRCARRKLNLLQVAMKTGWQDGMRRAAEMVRDLAAEYPGDETAETFAACADRIEAEPWPRGDQ